MLQEGYRRVGVDRAGLTWGLDLPGVWRGSSLAVRQAVCPSGHAALDAELPGGGWPLGAMTELLQAQATQHVWQLLVPALARQMQARGCPVVLVAPPADPFGPGVVGRGLDPRQLLCVQAEEATERLWVAEQALRCAAVTAVLAWLPAGMLLRGAIGRQGWPMALRRLQQAVPPQSLFFLLRPLAAGSEPSSARLRLALSAQSADCCTVRILKRRGPPLAGVVELPAHPPRLAAVLQDAPPRPAAGLQRPVSAEFFHDAISTLDRALAA
ncbi:MAG: hypothetical protein RLZZ126_799 [Pseudomonadota bacterium]